MTPACPACTAPDLELVSKIELVCSYCGTSFSGKPFICPACGWINTEAAELCHDCGEPMNVISQVLSRKDHKGEPQWLSRARSQASEIKSEEAEASRKRFEALEEIDRRRKAVELSEFELQKERDKRIFFVVLFVFVIILITLVVIMLVRGQASV
jgi:hypothetical protein